MGTLQKQNLECILKILIPSSECEKNLPGAVEVGLVESLQSSILAAELEKMLNDFDTISIEENGIHFFEMKNDNCEKFLLKNGDLWLKFKKTFGPEILLFYFRSRKVYDAYGIEYRPPYPLGYSVEEMNRELLKPVITRGKKYREISSRN